MVQSLDPTWLDPDLDLVRCVPGWQWWRDQRDLLRRYLPCLELNRMWHTWGAFDKMWQVNCFFCLEIQSLWTFWNMYPIKRLYKKRESEGLDKVVLRMQKPGQDHLRLNLGESGVTRTWLLAGAVMPWCVTMQCDCGTVVWVVQCGFRRKLAHVTTSRRQVQVTRIRIGNRTVTVGWSMKCSAHVQHMFSTCSLKAVRTSISSIS